MKKATEWIIRILIVLTFFVPLMVSKDSFIFPFVVPKILLFRSLVIFMLGCYGLLMMINWEEYRPRMTPLSIAVAAFLGSFFISTLVGVDAYHSFWDNHERMLGLFTVLHYVIYYFVCTAIFKTWTEWKWALRLFLLAGSIVMFFAAYQKLVDPHFLLNQGSNRAASSLGNAIYVGGYGLFLIFVALLLVVKERLVVWKIGAGILGALAFAGLIFSGTRGSLLGLIAGLFSVLVGYLILWKDQPKIRLGLGVAIAGGILALGLMYVYRQAPVISNIPVLGHLLNSSLTVGTSRTRMFAWKIAVESWKERPVFGWGPNNFFYAFNQHYDPRSLEYGYGETWFDNAHNIFLNTLAVQGLVGLLVYLALFAIAVTVLWRHKNLRVRQTHIVVIGSAFLIAHLAQNTTVFENPTSYLYFMFWLAFVNWAAAHPIDQPTVVPEASRRPKAIPAAVSLPRDWRIGIAPVVLVGALCLMLNYVFNIQPARANQKTLRALSSLHSNPLDAADIVRETVRVSTPHADDIRSDLSREAIQILNKYYAQFGAERGLALKTVIEDALQKNIVLHPRDIRTYFMLAQLNQLGFILTNDSRYLVEAERNLTAGMEYSPRRQQIQYMLASFKLELGKGAEAIAILESTIAADPKIAEGYWRLAYAHQMLGDKDKAREVLDDAKEKNLVFDSQGQQAVNFILGQSEGATGTQ